MERLGLVEVGEEAKVLASLFLGSNSAVEFSREYSLQIDIPERAGKPDDLVGWTASRVYLVVCIVHMKRFRSQPDHSIKLKNFQSDSIS